MIELQNIRKAYKVANFTQTALDGVSLTFRDNEFVAILGPSGSGKTTLLNILGGLDHADSGDIVINGVSTKRYKDADWDTYRNHRIGFIFQSYNLIPHQTIRANVELALTLSGVSREERQRRAVQALERVGLGEHIDKKPNQLSGGQMQRVAIARALINDPDIVLADEPTGALDTETGLQVMNLISEIAQDRLVIMVTHNPDLARDYATRIVSLADGRITDDTNPLSDQERFENINPVKLSPALTVFENKDRPSSSSSPQGYDNEAIQSELARDAAKGKKKYSSMSFGTALSLSFKNLMTKKGRTFLTAFAGSIGIIGIAAILALSNGVNNYIAETEEEALSSYPVTVTKSSFDISSLLTLNYGDEDAAVQAASDGNIHQVSIMSDLFAEVKNNDLTAFKEYLDSGESGIEDYTNAIQYSYGVQPLVYKSDTEDDVVQLSPSKMEETMTNGIYGSALSSTSTGMESFQQMIDDEDLVKEQMEVVEGHWPENYDEAVLVLTENGDISDYTLYSLGFYNPDDMNKMVDDVLSGKDVEVPDTYEDFSYEDALNMTFAVVSPYQTYEKNEEQGIWADKSDDDDYMRNVISNSVQLKIVGVVKPAEGVSSTMLTEGVAYTGDLIEYLANQAADSQIVKEQLDNPDNDVFTGKTFEELEDDEASSFDVGSMFTIDEQALANAFSFDTSSLSGMSLDTSSIDTSSLGSSSIDTSNLNIDTSAMGSVFNEETMAAIMAGAPSPEEAMKDMDIAGAQGEIISEASNQLAAGFFAWIISSGKTIGPDTDYAALYQEYLATDSAQAIMTELNANLQGATMEVVSTAMQTYMTEYFAPYLSEAMTKLMTEAAQVMATQMASSMTNQIATMTDSLGSTLANAISGQLSSSMNQLSSALSNGMKVDANAFANAIQVNMSEEDLSSLILGYMNSENYSYDENLKNLGYIDYSKPDSISLYAKDFEAKDSIKEIIDTYNENVSAEGEEGKTIEYSDIAGVLMTSVNSIVNMISLVLIAFVSISLVVSSIMIGIITYISVLERKKEIGILRAIGASKGNIANVFNAETIIEGLIAGVFAIAVVAIASFPVNWLVHQSHDVEHIMILPIGSALILIGISVLLTFIAGLFPSMKASRRDPVEALRSE